MGKRFTDTAKWRNEWFRTLPDRAKLAWIYLCDECESHGVMKADYGLATFQLGFKITPAKLQDWFGDKIHFISDEQILIVQFFEFQYGESKDSWSAKVRAKEKLISMGFSFENDRLVNPNYNNLTTVVPQSPHSGGTCLIRGIGISRVSNKGGVGEKFLPAIESAYSLYPRKKGKTPGFKTLLREIQSDEDAANLLTAVKNFVEECRQEKTAQEYILHFSTFANRWRDYIDWKPSKGFDEPAEDWTAAAQKVLTAVRRFGSRNPDEAKAFLGDELYGRVRAAGGLSLIGQMPANDFTLTKLAAMLKAAEIPAVDKGA